MRNRIIELDIVDLAYNGQAVAYDNGKVTFVNGGLPGERVEAAIIKSRKNHNQAKILRIMTKSSERIDPACQHFDLCGGCTWQDLDYSRQLYYKRKQVIDCLKHIGGFDDIEIAEIRPAPEQFYYRNKMEFSFHVLPGEGKADQFVLGLHERNRFDRIFDVNQCHLQSDMSNRIVNYVREKTAEMDIPVYDIITHEGYLRFLIIREGKNTGQVMLIFVTGEGAFVGKERLVSDLRENFPKLTTAVWMVNDRKANIARGEVREILFGPGFIEEKILGLRFRISPGSFFQTNSRQAEELYKTAIDLADLDSRDSVMDLYCGAGAIGICAAGRAGSVAGIDIEEEAIEAARVNCSLNSISNCQFHTGSAQDILSLEEFRESKFDVVFNDPPRAGMHPKALGCLLELAPRRLIYISCNPATFARDAASLRQAGYNLDRIIPFDMFPHTMHIELVSCFEKKGNGAVRRLFCSDAPDCQI